MKIQTLIYDKKWKPLSSSKNIENSKVDIIFVFGTSKAIEKSKQFYELRELFPNGKIVGCSSSGNILGSEVSSNELIATAISFRSSYTKISSLEFSNTNNVEKLSKKLINKLPKENLKHIFIMCDGLLINGSELVRGINKTNPNISITGGTAADDKKFEKTFILDNDIAKQKSVVAIGFYGEQLHISNGVYSGWSEFGPQRIITKSKGNTVYEIDNKPALDLYKKYLGEEANHLPSSALKFPISIKKDIKNTDIIRTVTAVNIKENSLSFAGDVPTGYFAKFMKADTDMLIEGAEKAALEIKQINNSCAFSLIVSCTGRLNVLNQLVEDELEAIEKVLGENVKLTGFYSYGEFGPLKESPNICHFHNQTITLTTFYEG